MSQPSPPFPELMISGKRKLPLSDNRGSDGHLWVPTTHPTRSCNESVLVNEAAEDSISM
jgi:hypothetical protein